MSTDIKLSIDSKVVKLGAYVVSVKGKNPKRILSNNKNKRMAFTISKY